MKPSSRLILPATTLALGLALGLQPLSLSLSSLSVMPDAASAKGGEGNGGNGGGNGDHGGGQGGGDRGANADSRGGGGAKGDRGESLAERGGKASAAEKGGPGASGRGHGEPLGLLEGFLADLRGDKKTSRSNGGTADKSKAASTEKSGKIREAKTPAEATTTTLTTTARTVTTLTAATKLPGNLNAAHASATARLNASPNSSVGKIAAYEKALSSEEQDLEAAAKALASLTDRDLTVENIEALNALLEIKGVDAQEVLSALDEVRNAQEQAATEAPVEADLSAAPGSASVTTTTIAVAR